MKHILEGTGESQEYDHEVYYGNPSHDDLAKMREEAERRQRGDAYKPSESTRIHFHRFTQDCNPDNEHEFWERNNG